MFDYSMTQQRYKRFLNDMADINIEEKQINYAHFNNYLDDYPFGLFASITFTKNQLHEFLINLIDDELLNSWFNPQQLDYLKNTEHTNKLLDDLFNHLPDDFILSLCEDVNLSNTLSKFAFDSIIIESNIYTFEKPEYKTTYAFIGWLLIKFFYAYYTELFFDYTKKDLDEVELRLTLQNKELSEKLYTADINKQSKINDIIYHHVSKAE